MKNRHNYIFIGLLLILFFFMMIWIFKVKQGEVPYLDQWTREFVELVSGTVIYSIFRFGTELGSSWFVQPLTIIATFVIWFAYKNYQPAFIFGFGVLGTHLFNQLIKELVARERPSISAELNAEGYSFPSGHAMVSIVCYGLLAYFIGKKVSSVFAVKVLYSCFALVILWIGVSRYIINVHYLTDIISGYTIGFVILFSLIKLHHKSMKPKKRHLKF